MVKIEWDVKKLGDAYHVLFNGWNGTKEVWSHIVLNPEEWQRFKKDVNKA